MDREEVVRISRPWRDKHLRPAWRPVSRGDAAGSRSRFGGLPLVTRGDAWPACRSCTRPMSFFVQLDLAALPASFDRPLRAGLLQLFYCSTDDGQCETWQPFSGTHLVRVVDGATELLQAPPRLDVLPATVITDWERFEDAPHPEEQRGLGLTLDYDLERKLVDVRCADPPFEMKRLGVELHVAELLSMAESGDKLGGWPFWVQSAEYPSCPECGARMDLVLQIDSDDHLPVMFGDTGCGHVTQCREHPRTLAFGWACS